MSFLKSIIRGGKHMKEKRNDPCACGSGKKHKKCCGKDNVLAFNSSIYTKELDQLNQQFVNFSFENFEKELTDVLHHFSSDEINYYDENEAEIYAELILAWALLTVPLQDDKTAFEIFYKQAKNTIKYPSVKQTFAKWGEAHLGVFEIFPTEKNVRLIDIATEETFYTALDAEMNYELGTLAVGCLVPYTETHEFFMLMIDFPEEFEDEILDLIEEKTQDGLTIKEVYPQFVEGMLQLGNKPVLEWDHITHEIVATLFEKHAIKKGYEDKFVQIAIEFWNDYCGMNDPIIRKYESHAAALDYFMQADLMFSTEFTQAQLAKEYGTSAGTISNHYRKMSQDFDLLMLEDEPASDAPISFDMDKELRDLMRLIEGQEFESEEEMNDFMEGITNLDEIPSSESPRDIAQDILSDARETSGAAREWLINNALDIYPLSSDAYLLLAEDERNLNKRRKLLEKAVDVGEKDLGEAFFVENKGDFWGLIETRPFMRAKAMYATYLENLGYLEEATVVYKELLALNPNDNQGIRYLLLKLYLNLEKYAEAWALIEEYDETTAVFMFSEALLHYKQHGITKEGLNLLKEATTSNPFVADYLLGRKKIPSERTDYIGMGDETEAIAYAQENVHLWKDAEEFLKKL